LQLASAVKQYEDPYFSHVSYNLLRIRKERKLSQQNMANLCNVERSKIGKMENKRSDFRFTTIVALARGLDVDLMELVKPLMKIVINENENGSK
jgi:putative transcriptional regulator